MQKLRVLDLFSGIGGFSLGLERTGGFETVAFCEIEEFPRKVLKKHWPEVPCFEDVRALKGSDVGTVDVICGGYPCQPFSTAGKRRGQKDDRHLWPEFIRLVAELRPAWVIGENVAGHISMGLDDVLSDLEGQGYAARTFVIPACALGAHHRRDRVWTVAHSGDVLQPRKLDAGPNCQEASGSESGSKRQGQTSHGKRVRPELGSSGEDVADTVCAGLPFNPQGRVGSLPSSARTSEGGKSGRGSSKKAPIPNNERQRQSGQRTLGYARNQASRKEGQAIELVNDCLGNFWGAEPNVGRVADGVPNRVDRLKALGNAVVPQIPEMIGYAILEAQS